MRDFFVKRDMILCGSYAAMPTDFSVRGFSAGQSEASATLTVTVPELWNPSMIATALWLDAADTDTITLTDGNVSQLSDKSGNGRHLTQATPAARPGISGSKLTLSGSQGLFHTPPTATFSSYLFIASVFDVSALTTYVRPPLLSDDAGNSGRPVDRWNYSTINGFMIDGFTSGETSTVNLRVTNSPRIHIMMAKKDAVSSGTHSVWERLNGSASYSGSRTKTWSTASQRITLGMRSDGVTSLNGWTGETVALEIEPGAGVIEKIEGYLAHKWGLAANLPSDHPYKTSAPTL